MRRYKKSHPSAAQLSLPGTLVEPTPPTVEEKLEWATAHIQEQEAECDTLRQQLRGLQMERYAVLSAKLSAEKALLEAKSKILMLQTLCDGMVDHQRWKAQETPVDQTWLIREMTRLLTLCHPDKWHGSPVAEELTKHVLEVRHRLQHAP